MGEDKYKMGTKFPDWRKGSFVGPKWFGLAELGTATWKQEDGFKKGIWEIVGEIYKRKSV